MNEVSETKPVEEVEEEERKEVTKQQFLPEDVVLSTKSTLADEDRQKVIRQIAKVRANQHFSFCLGHRFQL